MIPAGGVVARAPAKTNLQLAVGARRPDGFHDLATVFQAVDLWDEVVAVPADRWGVEVEGEQAGDVPADASNLALRAARLLAERVGVEEPVSLRVRKRIPVAGGMAGGSADAAAALVACDVLWDAGLPREALVRLGADLGSDVPFSLLGGTAVGTGRGERLTPALVTGTCTWVLALSRTSLSTPAVYAEADRLRARRVLPEPQADPALLAALRRGDQLAIGRLLRNDLQPAACSLAPELEVVLDAVRGAGPLGAVVSGSGPTVVALARDAVHAADLAAAARACEHVRDALVVRGPVHGTRLAEPVRRGSA